MATQTVVVIGARFQYCYATPANVRAGESATLNWSAPGATNVTITPGLNQAPATGSVVVRPQTDTTYVLTATGGGQTDRCTIAVTVGSGSGAVPAA